MPPQDHRIRAEDLAAAARFQRTPWEVALAPSKSLAIVIVG